MEKQRPNLALLLKESEHWKRVERLIQELQNLNGIYDDCKIVAFNSTKMALEGFPKHIQRVRKRGALTEAVDCTASYADVCMRSATETGIYVIISANSFEAYDAVKPIIFALLEQFQAKRDARDEINEDEGVPLRSAELPYDENKPKVSSQIHFSCGQLD